MIHTAVTNQNVMTAARRGLLLGLLLNLLNQGKVAMGRMQ